MTREVISVNKDSHGSTVVKYRVEDFRNFGLGMREIEARYYKERFGVGPSRDDDSTTEDTQSIAELKELTENMSQLLGGVFKQALGAAEQVSDQLEDMNLDEASKNEYKSLVSKMASSESFDQFLESLDDEDEDDSEEESDEESDTDGPGILDVVFDEPLNWTPEVQQQLDQFLDAWTGLREKVLVKMFQGYRFAYDEYWSFMEGTEADRIILPQPSDPNVIEDLFEFNTIYLSAESNAIGLSGSCTWDDEHGVGVRIEGNEVVAAGEADIAFV